MVLEIEKIIGQSKVKIQVILIYIVFKTGNISTPYMLGNILMPLQLSFFFNFKIFVTQFGSTDIFGHDLGLNYINF